ncbi:MAG: HdeA family protein [Succinivibrionaceae bacterium]|nr:HdeA family protein [Succinivibrionaceae bacterium]
MKTVKTAMLALALGSALGTPMIASAEESVDIMQGTCKEVLSSQENVQFILFWIDGYLSHESGNTSMDKAWIEKLGNHLGTFCSANPDKTIKDAIDALE